MKAVKMQCMRVATIILGISGTMVHKPANEGGLL